MQPVFSCASEVDCLNPFPASSELCGKATIAILLLVSRFQEQLFSTSLVVSAGIYS